MTSVSNKLSKKPLDCLLPKLAHAFLADEIDEGDRCWSLMIECKIYANASSSFLLLRCKSFCSYLNKLDPCSHGKYLPHLSVISWNLQSRRTLGALWVLEWQPALLLTDEHLADDHANTRQSIRHLDFCISSPAFDEVYRYPSPINVDDPDFLW